MLDALPFQLAGATVIGRLHQRSGRNNQDAFAWAETSAGIVAVVCDGCGSAPHSEVGAQLGARTVARALSLRLHRGEDPAGADLWSAAQKDVLDALDTVAQALGGPRSQAICDYLLFTIVGAVITAETTRCFSAGDGLLAVDSALTVLGPFADNAPPYLAYALLNEPPVDCRFELQPPLPTASIGSLVLGTDGALALLGADERAPDRRGSPPLKLEELIGDEHTFDNPDGLRRRLFQIGRDGLLGDDTTLVVLRRQGGA